jgi:WD40 repeat protein
VSPDGQFLAVPDGFGPDVLLVDAGTGRVARRLRGHSDFVASARFSGDGTLLATTSLDRSVVVWDVASGAIRFRLRTEEALVPGIGFSEDSRRLYTAGEDGAIRTWDVTGGDSLVKRVAAPTISLRDGEVLPSPTGDAVAYLKLNYDAVRSAGLAILDLSTGEVVRHRAPGSGSSFVAGAWHPDGRTFATVDAEGRLQLWRPGVAGAVASRDVAAAGVTDVAFTPDGRGLVFVEKSGRIAMADAETLRGVGQPVTLPEPACCLSTGPHMGEAVVLVGGPGELPQLRAEATRWAALDLLSGRVTERGRLGMDRGLQTTFAPDGRRFAVAGGDGDVVVIDRATGRPVHAPVVAHDDQVSSIDYDADGTRIVSAGGGSVALVDAATGTTLGSVLVPGSGVASASFGRSPHEVLVTTWTAGVYRWDTRSAVAVRAACNAAGRNLTLAEWRSYLGSRPYHATCAQFPPGVTSAQ